jgi:hypothetical protein
MTLKLRGNIEFFRAVLKYKKGKLLRRTKTDMKNFEMKELKFENAFIDGTKIEANANRYTFVWKGAVEKNRAKLLPKAKAFLKEVNARYGVKFLSLEGAINYLEH